jgi:hypothetical protein
MMRAASFAGVRSHLPTLAWPLHRSPKHRMVQGSGAQRLSRGVPAAATLADSRGDPIVTTQWLAAHLEVGFHQ